MMAAAILAFDGASAWALRLEMEASPADRFVVDLTHAEEACDFAAGILAAFAREGWTAERVFQGPPHAGFGLVRGWIENQTPIEIGDAEMRVQPLRVDVQRRRRYAEHRREPRHAAARADERFRAGNDLRLDAQVVGRIHPRLRADEWAFPKGGRPVRRRTFGHRDQRFTQGGRHVQSGGHYRFLQRTAGEFAAFQLSSVLAAQCRILPRHLRDIREWAQ